MGLAMMTITDLPKDLKRYMDLAAPYLFDPDITVLPVIEGQCLFLQLSLYGDEAPFFVDRCGNLMIWERDIDMVVPLSIEGLRQEFEQYPQDCRDNGCWDEGGK